MAATIDFNAIRPINGSRGNGFEEFCSQLARAECPPGSHFVRKGAPDAGVECYAVLENGDEWGWQAKYVDALGNTQWSEIDRSVRTAVEKHPRLTRYFVCVPWNRPDARVGGRQSAMERWDAHVVKWEKWCSRKRMEVKFEYWGLNELVNRMSLPENVGLVQFWFDVTAFDRTWFTNRLTEAIATAGPRYTPEVHIDLPVAAEFDAFGRTDRFFDKLKAFAQPIREALEEVKYLRWKIETPTVDPLASKFSAQVQLILDTLGKIDKEPVAPLPTQAIVRAIDDALVVADELKRGISNLQDERRKETTIIDSKKETASTIRDPFQETYNAITRFCYRLKTIRKDLLHAELVANNTVMILTGLAGSGKTHLLCDIANHRLGEERPTVLLMGQQFISLSPPWVQVVQQLGLVGLTAEEFVGALDAAAKAANCRALIMVDAINEGAGRQIWPEFLAAFIAQIKRSPWLGLVLSIRTPNEQRLIPHEILEGAVSIHHEGFAGKEYDAVRSFFMHYDLELPSTPLLSPEFSNPLFLKILCRGLKDRSQHRLPRGFQAIGSLFELYLGTINDRLANTLGFNPSRNLVREALESFVAAFASADDRWLEPNVAEEAIDRLLPGREYPRSLYWGMLTENVVIQESVRAKNGELKDAVLIAYDRLTDHIVTRALIEKHVSRSDPSAAFKADAPLAFLWDEHHYVSPGLLEAMCIQVPEKTGEELITLAPEVLNHWAIGKAFRQSIIWRSTQAFSDSSKNALNKVIRSRKDSDETFDMLITVATLPGHPFNADFLDRRLRREKMPARDGWWSVYLHDAWESRRSVSRLVDWASSIERTGYLEDETVHLCSTVLAWTFTSSNRSLRDHATKGLVNLLSAHFEAAAQLVQQFADVDDPYVIERVYAVAYGVAMRSNDASKVGLLADAVYSKVFASGSPPAHILLRDYARGVVERALFLKSTITVDSRLVRPPYNSEWPKIPSEKEIQALTPDRESIIHSKDATEWARLRIVDSVMGGDFARYIIGTNTHTTNWLSLRLEDPRWISIDDRQAQFTAGLLPKEKAAWKLFCELDSLVKILGITFSFPSFLQDSSQGESKERTEAVKTKISRKREKELDNAKVKREKALKRLKAILRRKKLKALKELLSAQENASDDRSGPRFDLKQIQRYIVWRVFDLGWTTKLFGTFDRFSIGYRGHESEKAERIGKKYQWIAYHEIMALIADHFQYREELQTQPRDDAYQGPWQDSLRDIDPSCTLIKATGGTGWHGHTLSWWAPEPRGDWGKRNSPGNWLKKHKDIPRLHNLLRVQKPEDASWWINVRGLYTWIEDVPAGQERTDIETREVWFHSTGYLIHSRNLKQFMKWAASPNFWEDWMPGSPEFHELFLGEHQWSPASAYFHKQYFGDSGWTRPSDDCPTEVRTIAEKYNARIGSFDCSMDESLGLLVPSDSLISQTGLHWSGKDAEFLDSRGVVCTFDPTARALGPSALLIREDFLRDFLSREKFALCWIVVGEKRIIGAGFSPKYFPSLRITGAYQLSKAGLSGFLKCAFSDPQSKRPQRRRIPKGTLKFP